MFCRIASTLAVKFCYAAGSDEQFTTVVFSSSIKTGAGADKKGNSGGCHSAPERAPSWKRTNSLSSLLVMLRLNTRKWAPLLKNIFGYLYAFAADKCMMDPESAVDN